MRWYMKSVIDIESYSY